MAEPLTYENHNPRPPVTREQWAEPCRCSQCHQVDTQSSTNLGPRKLCGKCLDQLLETPRALALLQAQLVEQRTSDPLDREQRLMLLRCLTTFEMIRDLWPGERGSFRKSLEEAIRLADGVLQAVKP